MAPLRPAQRGLHNRHAARRVGGQGGEGNGRARARPGRRDLEAVVAGARPPEDRVRRRYRETVTAWLRGGTWWSWSPSQGARTNDGRQNMGHGKGPGEVLIWPARITHVLDFELLGTVTALSRPAYRLKARPFTRGDFDLHSLGGGADEYELARRRRARVPAAGRGAARWGAVPGTGDDRARGRRGHPA